LQLGGDDYSDPFNSSYNFNPVGSSSQTPVHTYTANGNYSIVLRAYHATDYDDTVAWTHWVNLSSGGVAPVASFTINDQFIRIPVNITATDTSTNTPTSWQWSWGDGSANATTQNPQHRYNKRGAFIIILTATNGAGSNVSQPITVKVTGYETYW
jgi:PKD repeat protein